MLENQSKKILLLSNDPADASFLSEIAVMQQATLELVIDSSDLCEKIAEHRADHSLAAIFVDVTTSQQLRKFEYDLQSKMGSALALELSRFTHFISGAPLALNREVLQSPYFSFYSERKTSDFSRSVHYYQNTFLHPKNFFTSNALSFDKDTRPQFLEKLQKELLSKNVSAEWILKFKVMLNDLFETIFPARFECSVFFSGGVFKVAFRSSTMIEKENFRPEGLLNFGVSAMIASNDLVLFVPIYQEVSQTIDVFRFLKVER